MSELKLLIEELKTDRVQDNDLVYSTNKNRVKAIKFFMIGEFEISGGLIEILTYLLNKFLILSRVIVVESMLSN